jgi:hypothetical protein
MSKKRALKDTAQDPLAEKGRYMITEKRGEPGVARHVLTFALGVVVGLIGAIITKRLWPSI